MNKIKRMLSMAVVFILCLVMVLSSCKKKERGQGKDSYQRTDENVELNIWSYYSALQQEVFLKMVDEFNLGRGKDLNITVHVTNPGSMTDLETSLLSLTDKNFSQESYPDMAFVYRDTAQALDKKGYLVDMEPYFTEEELQSFVPEFLEEGRLGVQSKGIKILPVAKSTDLFFMNKTDWQKFSDATGCTLSDMETREGLLEVAKKYFEYTDSLTLVPGDGKAFFGQQGFANYFLIGAKQMGVDLITQDADGHTVYNFPKDVMRKLWDYFYVPYIHGYFSSSGRFRSDDVRTGDIICFTGSSVSYTYFPKEVILSDEEHYPIENIVLPCPEIVKGQNIVVQQGAGISVIKGEEAKIKASMEFLRWLTSKDINSKFAISAEYLPVRQDALTLETLDVLKGRGEDPGLEAALKNVSSNSLYIMPAVENAESIRNVLEFNLSDKAKEDKKAIDTAIASGSSREDAIQEYDTEENFNLWYDSLLAELETLRK